MSRLNELCRRVRIRKDLRQANGWFLVSAIIMVTFIAAVALALAGLTAIQFQDTVQGGFAQSADLVAEAGIEQSVDQLNAGNSGVLTNKQLFSSAARGCGTFTTTVTGSSTAKTIVSTGNVYRSAACTGTAMQTRIVRVTVASAGGGGGGGMGSSVYVGPGGLTLSPSTAITNTNVYVDGKLTVGAGAQIGTNSAPVTVDVGDAACPNVNPPGSTYPAVCSGQQPISMGSGSAIYGSVCATTNQTSGTDIYTGTSGLGFESNCTPPAPSPPTYDRLSQINAVTTTGSGSSAPYVCNVNSPVTWPANLELTGNVTMGGSCSITVTGNVYITGSLSIEPSNLTVASTTTIPPVIMVDGTILVNGSASIAPNGSNIGMQFISFKSSLACTIGTTVGTYCPTISGTDLYNSQKATTVNVSTANLPYISFDAYWGGGILAGSGTVGSFSAQALSIGGSGAIVFGNPAAGSSTWTITSYQPIYN